MTSSSPVSLVFVGGFVEVLLLTTIMVLRIREMRQEKAEIEASHKRYLEEAANELAIKVDEQTQQLTFLNEYRETHQNDASLAEYLNLWAEQFQQSNKLTTQQQSLQMEQVEQQKKHSELDAKQTEKNKALSEFEQTIAKQNEDAEKANNLFSSATGNQSIEQLTQQLQQLDEQRSHHSSLRHLSEEHAKNQQEKTKRKTII